MSEESVSAGRAFLTSRAPGRRSRRRRDRPGAARGGPLVRRLVEGALRAALTLAVVGPQLAAVLLAAVQRRVVFGGLLDLVLRAVHVDLLVRRVDALDHAGGAHAFLTEDPRAGVDDDVARPDLVGRLVDLPDRAVQRLDAVPRNVEAGGRVGAQPPGFPVCPDVGAHSCSFRRIPLLADPATRPPRGANDGAQRARASAGLGHLGDEIA